MEDGSLEDEHQGGDDQATGDGRVEAVAADVAGGLVAALTEEAGDHRATTKAEDVPDGDHQGEDRRLLGDPGDQVGVPGLGDEEGVDHVVDDRDRHAHDHREGQDEVGTLDRGVFK